MPLNLYFRICENKKGDEWFDVSFNGAGYPTIKEVEMVKQSLLWLLEKMEKIGQENLDIINKKNEELYLKEQLNQFRQLDKKKKVIKK